MEQKAESIAEQFDRLASGIKSMYSSKKRNKFDKFLPWVSDLFEAKTPDVGIKYISGNKQTNNRLGEIGSIRFILALTDNLKETTTITRRINRLFSNNEISVDAVVLATNEDGPWSIRTAFEIEDIGLSTALAKNFPNLNAEIFPAPIVRSIETPDLVNVSTVCCPANND